WTGDSIEITECGNTLWDVIGIQDPEHYQIARFFWYDLREALGRLPADQARAFTRLHIEGDSIDGIAKDEGLTDAAIRSRVFRARQALMPTMKKYMHALKHLAL